jgi:hypothetical protein
MSNRSFAAITIITASLHFLSWCGTDRLIAYRISSETSSFSVNDARASSFWSDWKERDSILLVPSVNSYPGRDTWNGDDDARMVVKAAWSSSGLYFLITVIDDNWVTADAANSARWQDDAVDFYLDALSSSEIRNGGESVLLNPAYGWALTYTSHQVMFWATNDTAFSYYYYDPYYYFSEPVYYYEFSEAPVLFNGMTVEKFDISPSHKGIEYFFPWRRLWHPDTSATIQSPGMQYAFTIGYNDLDGDEDTVKCMRWKTYDPFASSLPDNPGVSENALGSWGDIELGPPLEDPARVRHVRQDRSAEVYSGMRKGFERSSVVLHARSGGNRSNMKVVDLRGKVLRRCTMQSNRNHNCGNHDPGR